MQDADLMVSAACRVKEQAAEHQGTGGEGGLDQRTAFHLGLLGCPCATVGWVHRNASSNGSIRAKWRKAFYDAALR